MRAILIIIFMVITITPFTNAQFNIEDVQVGVSSIHYLDPEFIDLNGQCKMVFTDSVYGFGAMWVANINPLTGLFYSQNGLDLKVDTNIAPIYETIINGPEWGIDLYGLSLFYTKYNSNNIKQVWRAQLSSPPVLTQLTFDTSHCIHWAGTLNPADTSINFFLVRYMPYPLLFWTNENNVLFNNPILGYVWPGNNGPRFIPGTKYFIYSKQFTPNKIELVRIDMRNGTEKIITNDSIKKVDIWGFQAPEFNNDLCYSALISDTVIGVYRYINPNDAYATKFTTIRVPNGDIHKYIRSIEIIQTKLELFDTTYFAFLGATNPEPLVPSDAAMWIASLGINPNYHYVRRVDNGGITGDTTAYRQEPELLIGQNEVFLYYNLYRTGGIKELRRCRTGIYLKIVNIQKISDNFPPGYFLKQNYPNPFNPVTKIKFDNPRSGLVSLKVYDLLGREISTLVNENLKQGSYEVVFNGRNLPSGVYFYKLTTGNFTDVKKIILLK